MQIIKVNKLNYGEVADLTMGSEFLVHAPGYRPGEGPLTPARLETPLRPDEQEILSAGVPEGKSIPLVTVKTKYGVMYPVPSSRIYIEDENGTENAAVVETVGSQANITFYAPGMAESEVLERLHKALRAEFGTGVLQLRQESVRPVCETGLPTVLGVPDGEVPRLI